MKYKIFKGEKTMKKSLSLLLALCMIFALAVSTSVTAFAATKYETGSGSFTAEELLLRTVA